VNNSAPVLASSRGPAGRSPVGSVPVPIWAIWCEPYPMLLAVHGHMHRSGGRLP
jgi:hypothetical protein